MASKVASGEYVRGQSRAALRKELGPLKDEPSKAMVAVMTSNDLSFYMSDTDYYCDDGDKH